MNPPICEPPDFLGVDTSNQELWKIPRLSLGLPKDQSKPCKSYVASFRKDNVNPQSLKSSNESQGRTKKDLPGKS
jgi:hypothetical protein